MKVTCHFNSYASGAYQFCKHFASKTEAIEYFRIAINDFLDGIGEEGKPDAVMDVYPFTPEDNDLMSHGDYPMARYSVGRKRYGKYTWKYTIKQEVI